MIKENFIETLHNAILDNWNDVAFTDYGTTNSMTYADVATQIEKLHILFHTCGIEKNDRISLMGKNTSSWVTTYLAAVTYGAIIVPILQDFRANDAIHIINHSESKLLFIADSLYENMDISQMEQVQVVFSLNDYEPLASVGTIDHNKITVSAVLEEFKRLHPKGLKQDEIKYTGKTNKDIASFVYTSGTTGFSKGVILSLNALAGNVKFCCDAHVTYKGGRHVVFLPLAHSFGCAFDFLSNFCAGGHSWLMGKTPSPKVLLQAFAEVKPTCVLTVPLILEKIYKNKIVPQISKPPVSWVMRVPFLDEVVLSKLRQALLDAFGGCVDQVIIGGAPLNNEVDAFLKRIRFPYTVGYGMTECAPLISYVNWKDYKLQSCGYALDGLMEARVANKNEQGIGELQVRGEHLMEGYYKNEEATRLIFTKDGWLKTGDLGYIDEDGLIYIKGRDKNMILGPSGQNIFPEEIESILNNMPYVMESIVIQRDGQIVALVCPDFTAVDADHLTQEMVEAAMETNRRNLNAQIAAYEQVAKIEVYPHEFEKTPKKSIKRYLYTR
ncbi:MAG: AMP-binding protein [Paludibacteraceae bacterium]|nr:AMP-binding protein [Paludibacteraceae bacterium]MBR2265138.1 AMP-binding protein [Paludibacteraceae bacterium]